MKKMTFLAIVAVMLLSIASIAGVANAALDEGSLAPAQTTTEQTSTNSSASSAAASTNTIYDIAGSNADFEQLTAAVDAAGLASTLQSAGPFTVFAPTDAAFAAFAASGINPEAALADILLYHVVPGQYTAADVVARTSLPTAFGQPLNISVEGGDVIIDSRATVVATDIMASNGVIHVIDAVLPPPVNALDLSELGDPTMTIAEVAAADGRFSTLLAALDAAGLAGVFDSPGNYTVFAPTDATFAALPEGTIPALLADPQGELTTILTYHVVNDELSINQIANSNWLPTLEGRALQVTTDEAVNVYVDGCRVQPFNIRASNGVIHVVDCVLIP